MCALDHLVRSFALSGRLSSVAALFPFSPMWPTNFGSLSEIMTLGIPPIRKEEVGYEGFTPFSASYLVGPATRVSPCISAVRNVLPMFV